MPGLASSTYFQQQLSFDILLCQYSLNFSIGTMVGKVKKKKYLLSVSKDKSAQED